MSSSPKFFTFTWKIKNFSFSFDITDSPSFFVQEMGGTKWKLKLYPNSVLYSGCVACYLGRENDGGPKMFEVDYELSFLSGDGLVLQSKLVRKRCFTKDCMEVKIGVHARKDEVYLLEKHLFIPHDILTIRCRMWDSQGSITQSGKCFAETCIETECGTIVGMIKDFSSIELGSNSLVCLKSSPSVASLSSINLRVATDGKLVIEMKHANKTPSRKHKYKMFIRDISGNKLESGQRESRYDEPHTIPLTFSMAHLSKNKIRFLPNDELTIECEVTFPTGKKTNKRISDEKEDGLDSAETISDTTKTNFSSKGNHTECLTTLIDDLTLLFSEGVLYDTKLKTATETFPAHTIVLSARSSVFKSMFCTDMKEKINKCVDIDDLDADTVRRMLRFMYSDTLDNLNDESAKSLYFAADKYNIVSLKLRSLSFIKQNLSPSNCCEILLLADKHQDSDLKSAVEDFIAKNDAKVLLSDEWKYLEKTYPLLTTEVFRTIYMKTRKI